MKRFQFCGLLLVPALAVALAALPGCSKESPKGGGTTKSGGDTTKGGGDAAKTDTDRKGGDTAKGDGAALASAKTDGVIKGRVVFDGAPPEPSMIKAMAEHADKDVCLAGDPSEKVEQTWIIGKDKGVANVVVSLQAPKGSNFNVTKQLLDATKDAEIDQPHCAFVPHVVAMFAAYKDDKGKTQESGRKLVVKNSSKASHNTKISGDPLKNPDINKNINAGGQEVVAIKHQRDPLNVACDKHPWMNAKIVTFDHPYFAVTDKDGNFEIRNVPTDVELTVTMWHESKGKVEGKAMTFKTGDNPVELKITK